MSMMLVKAREQFEAGKYKAACTTLWDVEKEVRGGDDFESAQGLLDLALALHERTTGGLRDECEELADCARKAIDQGPGADSEEKARTVALGMAEYLGGSDTWQPSSTTGRLHFTPKRVLFGQYTASVVALMSDVGSIEIAGDKEAKSRVGATLAFGLAGLATKSSVDRTNIGVHMKSGAVPYFRLLNKNSIEVRALLGPVLRDAGVPFVDEAMAHAQQAELSPMDEIAKAYELFKAGALTEDEFKAAKSRLLN